MIVEMLLAATLSVGHSELIPPDAKSEIVYVACASEDSLDPCYWDARTMGNGKGKSFVVHPDQTIEYVNPNKAFPKH